MSEKYEIDDINEAGDQVVIRFAPDRSVIDLSNMQLDGNAFLPYSGCRFKDCYYVTYVPANSVSIRTLGRMGSPGNGEVIEIDSASWINPGDQFDAPGQGSASQWR